MINKSVLERLVRSWIDVSKLRINTTKGNVEIKGSLEFTGQAKAGIDSPVVIINTLKKLDPSLKAIANVKTVKYDFSGWKKQGVRWIYAPSRQQEKKEARMFGTEEK